VRPPTRGPGRADGARQVSWCKFEATVGDPKDLNPFAESDAGAPRDTPPLTALSLTLRTIVNHKENKREVVCATARVWANRACRAHPPRAC
jgi:DNA polymerase alpha subunit A